MLRFGTIGTSWITNSYIDGALDSGLWTLTAVYSRTLEKGRELGAKYGVETVFTDMEAMAQSDLIDAVYIASPNKLHAEHVRIFLENGKHVICEKPLSAHAKDVKALQTLAKERGLIYLEAIMFMHLPQRRLLEEALEKIGGVNVAKLDFCQRSSKYDAYLAGNLPNIFNPALETGALMDLGIYCVYPALYLFGMPERTQITAQLLASGADGSGIVAMQYPDKLVNLVYSKVGQAAANTDFQGNLGTVSVASISKLANIEIIYNDGSRETVCGEEPKYKLMGYEAKDFYRYITETEASAAEYAQCCALAYAVSDYMEQLRRDAGIRFPSDR
ncbi:MAG: Gfo/Idh/MocA family oxidoreductase [Ruminococcus bromii]|nr:Gfo/Idh/MocA family oxidoreductase [Ruminococcus bromii]